MSGPRLLPFIFQNQARGSSPFSSFLALTGQVEIRVAHEEYV